MRLPISVGGIVFGTAAPCRPTPSLQPANARATRLATPKHRLTGTEDTAPTDENIRPISVRYAHSWKGSHQRLSGVVSPCPVAKHRVPPPDIEVDRPLRPEYREPEDQQHQENHGENIEQEAGDVGGSRRNAGEAENAGDDRHQKEDQRPFENCHGVLRDLWGTPMAA